MNITVENQPQCGALLHIEIPAARVTQEEQSILATYRSAARLPGYRPGKAPEKLVRQKYHKEIEEELQQRLVSQAIRHAIAEKELPLLSVDAIEEETFQPDSSFTFRATITTQPSFELPDYKEIPVSVPEETISDEELDTALDNLRQQFAEYPDSTEQSVAEGNIAVIDFISSFEGTPLKEAIPSTPTNLQEQKDFWIEVKEDSFLPGFALQLIGAKPGEERTLTHRFADDFPREDLAGKELTFATILKGIKERRLPEIDEEFAAKVLPNKTLDDLKKLLKEQLLHQRRQDIERAKVDQILRHLSENIDFEVPERHVLMETQHQVEDIVRHNQSHGVSDEALQKNQEEIFGKARQQAQEKVKIDFILQKISFTEKIEVSPAEVQAQMQSLSQHSKGSRKQALRKMQDERFQSRIEDELRRRKALDFLLSHARIEAGSADCAPAQ